MKQSTSKLRQLLLPVATATVLATSAAPITSFPYTETAYNSSGWKTSNASSSNMWTLYSDYCRAKVVTGTNDSWLFSPSILVAEGCVYSFTYTAENTDTRWQNSTLDFYILPEADKEAGPLAQFDRISLTENEKKRTVTVEFEPTYAGQVYFAVADRSNGSTGYYTTFKDFSVTEENKVRVPKAVTGLSYSTSGEGGTTVSLTWTNPELDTFGDPLQIKHIRLDFNGEEYALLTAAPFTTPGATVTYTDPIARSGLVSYGVTAVDSNDAASNTVTLRTDYIGPFAGLDVPMELHFKNSPYNTLWTLTTGEGTQEWTIDEGADCMSVSVSNLSPVDATATTPAFKLSAQKAYRLTYTVEATRPSNPVYYSLELTGEHAQTLEESHHCNPTGGKETLTIDFTPAESGLLALSWHATAEKMGASYYTNTVSISNISIAELPVVPTRATGLTATAATDGSASVLLKWTNPTLSPTGLPLGALTATIMRNGTEVATIPARAGAEGTFTDRPETSGYHTYSVVIANENGASPEAPEKVTASYVGTSLEMPFTADFKNTPNHWTGMEYGDGANGNMFTIDTERGWASVTEAGNAVADMLVSAPVRLRAGRTYTATARCALSASNYSENAELYVVRSPDQAGDTSFRIARTYVSSSDKDMTAEAFHVEADGDYIFVVKYLPTSSSSDINFYVKGFDAHEVPTIPLAVSGLSAVSNYDEPEIDITFTLPAASTQGITLRERLTAEIFHAGAPEAIATLEGMPGQTLSYRHKEATPGGVNTYTVAVTLPATESHGEGGQSASTEVKSDWCGKGLPTPFASDFADPDHRDLWTVADQSGTYTLYSFGWDETAGAFVVEEASGRNSTSSNLDDWLITPPLYILDEAVYTISMEVKANGGTSASSNRSPKYAIYIGNTTTPADFTNTSRGGVKITPDNAQLNQEQEYATYEHTFSYTPQGESAGAAPRAEAAHSRPSKKFIAFRFGEKYNSAYPYAEVRSIRVATSIPTGIEQVADNGTAAPAVSYSGLTLTAAKAGSRIEVYSISGSLAACGTGSLSTETLPSGVYIVRCESTTLKIAR